MKTIRVLMLLVVTSICGCAFGNASDEEKFYQLASVLTKLSAAVEATVRYEDVPDGATSDDIVALSVAHDKILLRPFHGYKIKIHVSDRHAIVLICNALETEMYLEDAGCSKEMDIHHWKTSLLEACDVTLDVTQVCK